VFDQFGFFPFPKQKGIIWQQASISMNLLAADIRSATMRITPKTEIEDLALLDKQPNEIYLSSINSFC